MYEVLLFEIHDTLLLSKVLSKGFKIMKMKNVKCLKLDMSFSVCFYI